MKIVGSVLGTHLVDVASPIAYGYDEKGAAYCDNGPIFSLSSIAGQRGRRRLGPEMHARPTGRGRSDDPDFTVGRVGVEAPEEAKSEIWESPPVLDEQKRNGFQHRRRFPDFGLGLFGRFYADAADSKVGIVGAAAAGGARVHFRAKASPAALSGNAAERKNRAVVAVGRAFFVVAVGDGTGGVDEACSHHRANDFHFVCALRADAVHEAQGKRERRSVRGGQ